MMKNLARKEDVHTKPVLIEAILGKLDDCMIATSYQAALHKTHSSIGQHMRHTIEFIQTLLKTKDKSFVNYDERQRDGRIETDRDYAKNIINDLKAELQNITSDELEMPMKSIEAVHVQYDVEPTQSSFGRELLFVIAHTEHHFALIGAQCDALGVVLPDNFGKAISTLRHELSLKS